MVFAVGPGSCRQTVDRPAGVLDRVLAQRQQKEAQTNGRRLWPLCDPLDYAPECRRVEAGQDAVRCCSTADPRAPDRHGNV